MTNPKDRRILAFSNAQNRIITTSLTLLCAGGLLFALVCGGLLLINFLAYFIHIVGPVIVAFYLSLLTRPWYERLLGWTKGNKLLAILLFALSFALPLAGILWGLGSFVVDQLQELPRVIENFRAYLVERFPNWHEVLHTLLPEIDTDSSVLFSKAADLAGTGWTIGLAILKASTTMLLWLLTFFYWIIFVQIEPISGSDIAQHFPFLSPRGRHAFARYITNFNDIMVSYFRGQMIDVVIQGVLYGVAFQVVGLPSGFIIGFIVGLLNLLPYLGAIVGVLFTVPLAFSHGGFGMALVVSSIICCIQSFDGYIMQPYIQGSRMKLSSWLIVFALLFWAQVAGFLGVLLAIPITAFIKASWGEWRTSSERFIEDYPSPQQPKASV